MDEEKQYSIGDLARLAGLRPRTIHFYIRRGLIEGVGKKGPNTRYPESYLHRLKLIRLLKDEARLTLEEIGRMLPSLSDEQLKATVPGEVSLETFDFSSLPGMSLRGISRMPAARLATPNTEAPETPKASPTRPRSMAGAASIPSPPPSPESSPIEQAWPPPPIPGGRPDPGDPDSSRIADLLTTLQGIVGQEDVPRTSRRDRWVSIPVTQEIVISARGLRPHEVSILERVGDHLRRILSGAIETDDPKEV